MVEDPAGRLRSLLLERPGIIPAGAVRTDATPLTLALSGLFPGCDRTGILAFSPAGDVAVIDCCGVAEGGACSSAVLGRILEDAAALGGSEYWELDAKVREQEGISLADAMNQRLGGIAGWDRKAFEKRVDESVRSGDVGLVIVLDRPDERLLRTIRFIWQAWAVVLPLRVVVLSEVAGEWQAEIAY